MPELPRESHFSLAPDWVCEVLSPSTERIDRSRKLGIHAAAGVAHAWLVNPVERTLEVLRLGEGVRTIVAVHAGAEGVRRLRSDSTIVHRLTPRRRLLRQVKLVQHPVHERREKDAGHHQEDHPRVQCVHAGEELPASGA
jgi:hypothetical protein